MYAMPEKVYDVSGTPNQHTTIVSKPNKKLTPGIKRHISSFSQLNKMTKLSLKKFQTPAILLFAKTKTKYFLLFSKSNLILSLPSPHATIAPVLSQTPTPTATTQLQHLQWHNTTEHCKLRQNQPLSRQKTSKSSFSSKTILRQKLSCSFQHLTVTRRFFSLSFSFLYFPIFFVCIFVPKIIDLKRKKKLQMNICVERKFVPL